MRHFRTDERFEKTKNVLEKRQPTLTVVFENINDPHNISAALRSCDAVGVWEVHLIYHSGQTLPKFGAKSSASARKWLYFHKHDSVEKCYAKLREKNMKIYTTHMQKDSISLHDLDLTQPVALVFGNEHDGVSETAVKLADGNFLIPQVGMIQSLNISVACAVSLYEAYRQRLNSGMYASPQLPSDILPETLEKWLKK
ncbi:MAG: TrmH family RNA methyltransferase [Bacteroidota bacterium]|jgi:tRNA (guanosine-2'-O-)-methyltransferase